MTVTAPRISPDAIIAGVSGRSLWTIHLCESLTNRPYRPRPDGGPAAAALEERAWRK